MASSACSNGAPVPVLGIDTCGATGTLALGQVSAGELHFLGAAELPGRTAAAMLIPALDQMLRNAGLSMQAVGAIVVVDGPGSFTGIRIGLSAAKGLSEALGVSVFAVSRLRVLAAVGATTAALLDAGRGEFYFLDEAGEEWLLAGNALAGRLGAGAAPAACETKVMAVCAEARLAPVPTAADAVRVSLPDLLAGRSVDVSLMDGRYVRRSDLYRTSAQVGEEAARVPEL